MKARKIIRNPNYKFLSALPLIGIGVCLPQQSGKAMIRRFATSTISNTARLLYGNMSNKIPRNTPITTNSSRITNSSTLPSNNISNQIFYRNTKLPIFSSTGNNPKNLQTLRRVSLPRTSQILSSYLNSSSTSSSQISSSISSNPESVQTLPKVTLTKTNKISLNYLDTPNVSSNISVSKSNLKSNSNLESKTNLAPLLNMNQSYYKLYFENDDTNTTSNNVINTHSQSAKNIVSGNNHLNNSLDSNKSGENPDPAVELANTVYNGMAVLMKDDLRTFSSIRQELEKINQMIKDLIK